MPGAKVSGEGIEVAAQTIGGEGGDAVGSQAKFQVVDEGERAVFAAAADVHRATLLLAAGVTAVEDDLRAGRERAVVSDEVEIAITSHERRSFTSCVRLPCYQSFTDGQCQN